MASDGDEANERLIENYTPRLRRLIKVDLVLDHMHFIEPGLKEPIRQRAKIEGDYAAAGDLISAAVRKPRAAGWFRAFVDALSHGGCQSAADIMQAPPDPEVEAENDYSVKLVEFLSPSLLDMATNVVCHECFSQKLINKDDDEIIRTTTTNQGNRSGARELLRCIVRGRPGWFSDFLEILRKTEHKYLLCELTGEQPDSDKKGSEDKPPSVKDEPMETDAPAAGERRGSLQLMDITFAEEPPVETDLYGGAPTESTELSKGFKPSQPDSAAADGGPEKADIVLRDYQKDVASPALEGKNIIICLPTGSGKTRVAVYITKKHLDCRRAEGRAGKVVVLVNKVPLVEQHYSAEFLRFLKATYKVERVSGDCQLKISFTEIVKNNDVIICTAQILENFLERSKTGEDEGVNLSGHTSVQPISVRLIKFT